MKELRIAVVGDRGVEDEVSKLNGKRVRGLTIRVVKVKDPAELKKSGVNILYLGQNCRSPQQWKSETPKDGRFTVDSSSPETALKADARFVQSGDRVRFQLNVDELRRSGLRISPRLVKVASRLYTDRDMG